MNHPQDVPAPSPTVSGPYHLVAHCTFCGTSDICIFPGPRAENEAYYRRLAKPMPADICHFETHPTYCVSCCEVQEDGHEYEHDGYESRCKHCDAEPPYDWNSYED